MEFGATEDYCCNDLKLVIDRLLCQTQLIYNYYISSY